MFAGGIKTSPAVWPGRAKRWLLDALLPHRCLVCAAPNGGQAGLCPLCEYDIAFIRPPVCDACGVRIPVSSHPGASCLGCRGRRTAISRRRAVFDYDAAGRGLVLSFKYGDRLDAAPVHGAWMARAGAALTAEADVIVAVPLHRRRLWARRYNQAAVLAGYLGKQSGRPVCADALIRRRATKPQIDMNMGQRRRNVAGAFAVPPSRTGVVAGRRVLLIDDVLTSGATAEACAETLKAAGAAAVDVLTLARARRPKR